MSKRKRVILWITIPTLLIAAPFLLLFGYIGFLTAKEHLNRVPFESSAWKRASVDDCQSKDATRIRMVDDLLNKNVLKGISKQEVEGLLGEPDQTMYFKNYDMVYCLGRERGFMPLDSEWLVLKLNQGHVQEFRVVRD